MSANNAGFGIEEAEEGFFFRAKRQRRPGILRTYFEWDVLAVTVVEETVVVQLSAEQLRASNGQQREPIHPSNLAREAAQEIVDSCTAG